MRRKSLTFALVSCLIVASVHPLTINAESVDGVVDEILNEEPDVFEGNILDSENEETQDQENIFSDGVCIDSIQIADTDDIEQYIEDYGYSDESSISLYSDSPDEFSTSEYAVMDGYTQVDSVTPIEFKYEGNTLYFRLQEGISTAAMPGETTSRVYEFEWVKNYQSEAKNVTKIVIGDGITALGGHNFEGTYNSCFKKVEEVVLPSSLTEIGAYAFQSCSALNKIDLTNVTNIGTTAFSKTGLQNISLADHVVLETNAFYSCKSLTSVTAKNVTLAEGTFSSCKSLKTFQFKGKIETVPKKCFSGCWALESFDFLNVKEIGDMAFNAAKVLEKISFGQIDIKIGSSAFNNCTNLSAICYPATTEKWKEISENATVADTVKVHCQGDTEKPKAATCTELGLAELVCAVCGEAYTDGTEIPELGHDVADTYTVDKIATCTETGEQSKHCTREGCEYREDIQTLPIDSENHDWTSAVTTEPTCTKEGVLTYTCSRCKGTKTEPIKATGVHQWSDWKTTKAATVFEAKQQTRTCSSCDKTETQTVGTALKAKASVNASTVKLKVNKSTSGLKVTRLANGDSVKKWKSSNTKIFTVSGKADGTCKLTAKKKGTAKLEITMASGLKKTVTVKVQSGTVATTKISGLTSKLTIKKGSKTTLKPVITPFTSTQKVTYSSSNKKIATVTKTGKIKGVKKGTATITVKSGSVTKKVKVTVR